MSNKNVILVPYDFTEEADCALNHAIGLSSPGDTIYLNHILDKKALARLKSTGKSVLDLPAELEAASKKFNHEGIDVKAMVKEGDIFEDIPSCASEVGAYLMIFGTHGVHGMQHILGALSLKLVTTSHVPVIIVQRRPIRTSGYKKIVYPVDENPYSKQKAFAVAEFALKHKSEVLVFAKRNGDEHFQRYTDGNQRYSEKVFEEAGVTFTTFENTKTSGFGKLVIDFAAKHDADLISITTQDSGDLDLGDIFVGSEDVKIINNEAEIPSLCINARVTMKVGGLAGVTGS